MTAYTHDTVPTRFVEANGIRFAYRRFGKTGGAPIVMNLHFRGTMDLWDPAVTDGLAQQREVILFDNAGIGASSGKTPTSFPEMARDAIAFIKALGIGKTDVLGYSIGGQVAQEIAVQASDLVRKLIWLAPARAAPTRPAANPRTSSRPPTIRPNMFGSPRTSCPIRPAERPD